LVFDFSVFVFLFSCLAFLVLFFLCYLFLIKGKKFCFCWFWWFDLVLLLVSPVPTFTVRRTDCACEGAFLLTLAKHYVFSRSDLPDSVGRERLKLSPFLDVLVKKIVFFCSSLSRPH
jgi:hypothetical protein